MSGTNGRDCPDDAAAYVLGALEPNEAEEFRRHVADCAACQEEVAAFEQVTDALPAASPRYEVPRGLRRRVMREARAAPKTVRRHRRQRARPGTRRPLAWAGGLAAVAAAAIVAVALIAGGSSETRVVNASVTGVPGAAQLRIAGDRGELIAQGLPQPPSGRIYEMWVQRGQNAQPTATGTLFGVTARGSVAVGVPGSLHGVRAVLVTEEPAGGSLAPTRAPVVVARVS
ncbi:MAG: anti-sigma factor [Solirubrobacterales bacterium]|nr:anti-sigma factor [Solirubrobacterales bacterium]